MNEMRSFLRKREAWLRSNPQADNHVRQYFKDFTDTDRMKFVCPKCGNVVRNMDRPRDASGRLKKHCGCRSLDVIQRTPEQIRAARKEYKAKLRRAAGCRLRTDIKAQGQSRREAIEKTRTKKLKQHDAHVRRYRAMAYARAASAKKYKDNPQKQRERQSTRKKALPDSYVIQNLKAMGIDREFATPKMIALKREAMMFRRLSLQAKTKLKNYWKEDHEAIK